MTYDLAIGDCTYSSWSLRGWLVFDAFGIPVNLHRARMYTDEFPALLAQFPPARLVPTLRLPDGTVVPETAAIGETIAERHPGAGHWPEDPSNRAVARSLVAEMNAGFTALRGACAMNLAHRWDGFEPSAEVLADLARLEQLWHWAWTVSGTAPGVWLFGAYSIADAFFAPVAARIAGYGLPVESGAQDYVAAHLAHPSFRRWRAMGVAENYHQSNYDMALETSPWPGPEPIPARAVEGGPSVNDTCPYSGKPVTDFMAIGDRVFGFCNPFCRDKTVADPAAWPGFMSIYNS